MSLTENKGDILVVDDTVANLRLLANLLTEHGYKTRPVPSGNLALNAIRSKLPDLILLDINMPGLNGYEVCRQLKSDEKTRDIPVIFISAMDEVMDKVKAFEVGGVDYVTKPIQFEEVLARVETHLSLRRLQEELRQTNRELAELNARLEQKVAERTRDLRQKVKELEGRDRIAQHLLLFHSLEETLGLILEVIADIIEVDQALIYLTGKQAPSSAIGLVSPGVIAEQAQLDQYTIPPVHSQALDRIRENRTALSIATPEAPGILPFVMVPILKADRLLGTIQINHRRPIPDETLQTLERFAVQAAVAINDARILEQDTNQWKNQIEAALDLDELQLDDVPPTQDGGNEEK